MPHQSTILGAPKPGTEPEFKCRGCGKMWPTRLTLAPSLDRYCTQCLNSMTDAMRDAIEYHKRLGQYHPVGPNLILKGREL